MGIQTSGGGIFNSKGIESEQVKVFSQTSQARNLDNFKNIDSECQIYHDERVLSKQCDYFIPAGHELSINSRTAKSLNCKVMVEAANGPVSFEAEQILL